MSQTSPPDQPTPPGSNPGPASSERGLVKSGKATAALVLGIIGLATSCLLIGVPLGIVALILGIAAINQIDNPANRLTGRGVAQTGAILGGVATGFGMLAIVPLLIGIMLPALQAAREAANKAKNSANMRSVVQSVTIFAQDHNEALPNLNVPNPTRGADFGTSTNARMSALVASQYILPKNLVNPADEVVSRYNRNQQPAIDHDTTLPSNTVSYALLRLYVPAKGEPGQHPEWAFNLNSQAPLAADRTGDGDNVGDDSVWDADAWEGGVGWGDGHAGYEEDKHVATRVNVGNRRRQRPINQDDLWSNKESAPGSSAAHPTLDDISMSDPAMK